MTTPDVHEIKSQTLGTKGQSAFVQAYWRLVDASGLSDEEFSRRAEEATRR